MEPCSQHSNMCDKVFNHESRISRNTERLDQVEIRLEKLEEVQAKMIAELQEAAAGLRGLASKIDDAISVANGSGHGEGNPSPAKEASGPKKFSDRLNEAWEDLERNFVKIIMYTMIGGAAWALYKTLSGDWKETPKLIKMLFG